ncbi:MAG: hypothetical protein E7261_06385 [Lachnospiraceae bacterium]|nr:hypothetical protein [Lachnospiraceae bacterium]
MFEKRQYDNFNDKLKGLKDDLDALMELHGYVDCSKALLLYVYIFLKTQPQEEYDTKYIDIPREVRADISKSPEKFCAYINSRTEVYNKVQGRTLRDYYEKYKNSYNLEIILSKREIVKLFLYYHPYPKYDRQSLKENIKEGAKTVKHTEMWTVGNLQKRLKEWWGYECTENTVRPVLAEFNNFDFSVIHSKGNKKGNIVLEWEFSKKLGLNKSLYKGVLPKYSFTLRVYGAPIAPYEEVLLESDCYLLDQWVNTISYILKTTLESENKIKKVCIKRSCKYAEYVYQYLKRNNVYEPLVICD